MTVSSGSARNSKRLLMVLWGAFLCYGPVALFVILRFNWQLLALNANSLVYIGVPAIEIVFDDANAEGFVKDVGTPPENQKNPYPPMFW